MPTNPVFTDEMGKQPASGWELGHEVQVGGSLFMRLGAEAALHIAISFLLEVLFLSLGQVVQCP